MAEFLVIVAIIVSALALSFVSWLAELVARLVGVPFGAINWFLHGLGFLVMLPFVVALLVLVNGFANETWWIAGAILFAALLSFVGGGIKLAFELASGGRERVAYARVAARR